MAAGSRTPDNLLALRDAIQDVAKRCAYLEITSGLDDLASFVDSALRDVLFERALTEHSNRAVAGK